MRRNGRRPQEFCARETRRRSRGFRNELLYTGRQIDPETGLQLNRHRFYHQQLGRWVSRDPIGYWGAEANLYGYVQGAPLSYHDPIGMDREWVVTHPLWPHTFLRVEIDGKCYQLHFSIIGRTLIPCPPGGTMGKGYVLQFISSTREGDLKLVNNWQSGFWLYIPFIHDCNMTSFLHRYDGKPCEFTLPEVEPPLKPQTYYRDCQDRLEWNLDDPPPREPYLPHEVNPITGRPTLDF